jgi:hypothetical protein
MVNAIYDAIGERRTEFPMSPPRLLEVILAKPVCGELLIFDTNQQFATHRLEDIHEFGNKFVERFCHIVNFPQICSASLVGISHNAKTTYRSASPPISPTNASLRRPETIRCGRNGHKTLRWP